MQLDLPVDLRAFTAILDAISGEYVERREE